MASSQTRVRVAPNLYQRGDGRFVAGLTVDGRWTMKTLTARTKREAKLQLARLQADPSRQARVSTEAKTEPPLTVSRIATEFLSRFEALVDSGERSPRTLDHYAWALRAYLLPAWGEWKAERIGPDQVVALSEKLRRQGHGPSVMKAVEETASRLFSFAVRRGYIDSNPIAKLERGERVRVKNDDRRVLTHDEILRLLQCAQNPVELTLLAVLLYAGLRQGELLGLRWGDIDFDQGMIRLRLQLQRPRGGGKSTLAPLKMQSERDVVLVPQVAELLKQQQADSAHTLDTDFVFAEFDGSALHYSRMNRLLKRVAKTAKVERLSAHVFRRTFASHLIIEEGLDVVRVQRQLGHSRPSVTYDRYSFLFEQARHATELRDSIAASPYAALLSSAQS